MLLKKTRAAAAGAVILAGTALTTAAMLPLPAAAQSTPKLSVPESEAATAQARIRAINTKTRLVTLTDATGMTFSVTAGPEVRLNLLRVGDRVDMKFYRSVAFAVTPPRGGNGVPANTDQMKQLILQPVEAPGGVVLQLTQISGTIVGIDMASHRLDLVNPSGGGVFSVDVTNPDQIQAMQSLKVGDTVTAVISDAVAVSIEPARRRWF
jgi:Cu/Ag efflux protein CusF